MASKITKNSETSKSFEKQKRISVSALHTENASDSPVVNNGFRNVFDVFKQFVMIGGDLV